MADAADGIDELAEGTASLGLEHPPEGTVMSRMRMARARGAMNHSQRMARPASWHIEFDTFVEGNVFETVAEPSAGDANPNAAAAAEEADQPKPAKRSKKKKVP